MRRGWSAIVSAVAMLAAACSGSDEAPESDEPAPAAAETSSSRAL